MAAASPTARIVLPFDASASAQGCDAFPVHTRAWTTAKLASCATAIIGQSIRLIIASILTASLAQDRVGQGDSPGDAPTPGLFMPPRGLAEHAATLANRKRRNVYAREGE